MSMAINKLDWQKEGMFILATDICRKEKVLRHGKQLYFYNANQKCLTNALFLKGNEWSCGETLENLWMFFGFYSQKQE